MRRLVVTLLLVPGLGFLPFGCGRPAKDPENGNLVLTLPPTTADDYADRKSKLTVDGKDYSEPRGTQRTLQVTPASGNEEVTVVYSFWPVPYVNRIRTKIVKLDKDKPVHVDMTKEDSANPDEIKPIYVPTSKEVVEQMCKMAKITPNDVVWDIGCGDGRMVISAVTTFKAKRGVGIDIRPELIKECEQNAKAANATGKVEFKVADALKITDFSEASVVLLYLGDDLNMALKPALKKSLKPGSRVVSHRFIMGDDWQPDVSEDIITNNANEKNYKIHLWNIK